MDRYIDVVADHPPRLPIADMGPARPSSGRAAKSTVALALAVLWLTFGLIGLIPGAATATDEGATTSASAQESSALIEFDSTSTLTLGTTAAHVLLVNHAPHTWDLDVTVVLYAADGSEYRPPARPTSLTLDQVASIDVGPAATASAGSGGFIVVTATHQDQTVSLSRSVAVAASPQAAPAIPKWSGSSNDLHFGATPKDIPLTGECGTDFAEGDVVMVAGGITAMVKYRCDDPQSTHLTLDTSGVTEVGKYEGTLKVADTEVALTYLHSRTWLWAAGAILVGFAVAAFGQTVANNKGPIRTARRAANALKKDAARAQDKYETAAGSAGADGLYNVATVVETEVATLNDDLKHVLPTGFKGLLNWILPQPKARVDEALKPVVEKTAELRTLIANWPKLATDLNNLAKTLDGLPGDQLKRAPGISLRASDLLGRKRPSESQSQNDPGPTPAVGPPPLPSTATECQDLLDEVLLTTAALDLLPHVEELRRRLVELETAQLTEEETKIRDAAQGNFNLIRAELADARKASDLSAGQVDPLLEATRRDLRRIARTVAPDRPPIAEYPMVFAMAVASPLIAGSSLGADLRNVVTALPRLSRRIYAAASGGTGVTMLWLLVSLVVAVWSGLAALYVDKPWGTGVDFLVAAVWGFTATALLTPLLSTVESLMDAPRPVELTPGPERRS